jgi:hypothetical protein
MFAILFMDLLANSQYFCNGISNFLKYEQSTGARVSTFNDIQIDQCNANFIKFADSSPQWTNNDVNYDNILNSFLSLFILSTLEAWPDYMNFAVNGTQTGPSYQNSLSIAAVFIAFILIGSIFCINLFIAIIGINFHMAQATSSKNLLT